jgi:NADPH:quinone reductase-like Zn-dependent oxidoreductase
MRQVWITKKGPPEVLVVRETPEPRPGPGTVRVRVQAAGVNFADLMMRLGLYPGAPRLPAVPGYEVAGTIDAVGSGVPEARLGEEVVALCDFGGYSELVCVPAEMAMPRPAGSSPEEVAALPVNYLTAYEMLVILTGVGAGQTVLIHGAAGGVGLAALQICHLRGARVLGSASPAKHDFLREQGVEHLFDSRQARFAEAVRAATGGRGVDVVLEPRHGGWIRESYRALGPTGRLVLFGFSSAAPGKQASRWAALKTLARVPWLELNPLRLMNDNKGVAGVHLGRLGGRPDLLRAWLEILLGWLGEGRIRPRVDRIFPFAAAPAAHHYLHERRNIGKVLLVPGDGGGEDR